MRTRYGGCRLEWLLGLSISALHMSLLPDTASLVVALMTAGTGTIFFWYDRDSLATRALSACLLAIGIRLLFSGADDAASGHAWAWLLKALTLTLESGAIFAAIEWGRRIGLTAQNGPPRAVKGLFLASKILIAVYWGLGLGYLAIAPEMAIGDSTGVVRARGIEFAIFAPILGTSILLTGIAIATLRLSRRIDSAELIRLRALSIAGPFLLAALIFSGAIIHVTLTLGLLVFLWGSVKYLLVQTKRGEFMRQFLSPEVARVVQQNGIKDTLKRERRVLSVVICDLRGFTNYARQRDSEEVVTLLERFYQVVGDAAEKHGGTVKDHAGDGVLVLVGAPLALGDHAHRAVLIGQEIQKEIGAVIDGAEPALGLGVGIATGNLTIGAIQGAGRLEYVAVGTAVNLAARLCDRAEHGEILSDTRTIEFIEADAGIRTLERQPEALKGFAEPIPVVAIGLAQS
ncbi:MAG: adenylate cyclase [Gammaproteobacteria bacterium]|jgi:adenylate cyclase